MVTTFSSNTIGIPKKDSVTSGTGKFSISSVSNKSYSPTEIRQAIGMAESRGEKNPYQFSRFSGKNELGNALGKYQVTEGELKSYAKRYLGKDVTSQEFLTNPKFQDDYINNKVADQQKQGIGLDDIISNHRGGINSKVSDYQDYVNSVKSFLPTSINKPLTSFDAPKVSAPSSSSTFSSNSFDIAKHLKDSPGGQIVSGVKKSIEQKSLDPIVELGKTAYNTLKQSSQKISEEGRVVREDIKRQKQGLGRTPEGVAASESLSKRAENLVLSTMGESGAIGKSLKSSINITKEAGKIPETLYRKTLKALTGKESLTKMSTEELQKVDTALKELPKSKEGKIIPDVPNKRGTTIDPEFAKDASKLDDLGQVESSGVSLLDPLRAAEKLDKRDNGVIKRVLIRPVQDADNALVKDAEALKTRVKEFVGKIKSGSSDDVLIRKYGERITYPKNFTDDVSKKITPEIKRAAESFRQVYDELLVRLNDARKFAGRTPIPKRADYFTHSEELGLMSSLFGKLDDVPGELLRITDYTKPNSPFFKFALPRTYKETTAGAIEGFQRYLNSALPVIHYTKPIVNLRAHIPYLPPRASKYFNDWTNELSGKTAVLDRPFPQSMLKLADWLRGHTSKGSVLGNFSTAFMQLSSVASTVSRTGLKKSIAAIPASFSDAGIAFAEKYSKVLQGRAYDPDISPGTLSSLENLLGWGIQTLDRLVVRHSFTSAFADATSRLKMPFEEAVKYADDIAQKTQASNRKVFQPPLLRSKVGGTLGQLQTFTTNFYNQIRRDIPLISKQEGGLEAVKTTMLLFTTILAINEIYQTAGLPTPYSLTSFVPGAGSLRYGTPTPALKGAFGAGKVVFGTGDTRKEGVKDIRDFMFSLIPGGRQLQKTIKGIKAISDGGVRTDKGKLKYPIEGPAEKARALLFGPNATKSARDYYNK